MKQSTSVGILKCGCFACVISRALILVLCYIAYPSLGQLDSLWVGQLADDNAPLVALDVNTGIQMAFQEYHQKGGFCNRSLQLMSNGNGTLWNTTNMTDQAERMINDGNILAFLGVVGAEATAASLVASHKYNIPIIAPINGSHSLRSSSFTDGGGGNNNNNNNRVFHLRASQADEALAVVQYLRVNRSLELLWLFYEESVAEPYTLWMIESACNSTGLGVLAKAGLPSGQSLNASVIMAMQNVSQPFSVEGIILVASASTVMNFISFVRQIVSNNESIVFGIVSGGTFSIADILAGDSSANIVFTQALVHVSFPIPRRYFTIKLRKLRYVHCHR